jgi:CrcB protein
MPATAAPQPHVTTWLVIRHAAALYALIAFGSAIGGVLRAIASLAVRTHAGPDFPWGTLFVNVTGSFAIGFYATLTGPGGRLFAGSHRRQFVMTGICGGYTTCSVFSLETLILVQAGYLALAGLNIGVSTVGWLAAVWLGHILAVSLNRLKGS